MKCEKCGRETAEDEKICRECREKQDETNNDISDEELLNKTIYAEVSEVTDVTAEPAEEEEEADDSGTIIEESSVNIPEEGFAVKEAAAIISLLVIPRILALAAILCMLLPFMKITYGGQLTEISGKDLIFGGSSISLKERDSEEYEADGDMFNWFVMLAGVAALGTLVGRTKEAYKCGIASSVLLIVFRLTARIYYQIGDMSIEEYELNGWMKAEFCGALYWTIGLLLTASAVYFGFAKLKQIKMNNKHWRPSVH